MPLSIVLAEDHVVVRDGLRRLLEVENDFTVVGETGDGLEVVDLVVHHRPDVLVLDIMLPGSSGPEIARQVKKKAPKTAVLMLSMHSEESYVLESLRHGASGYVAKSADSEELLEAIRAVAAGHRFLSADVVGHAAEAYAQKAREMPADPLERLTTRERQVLHLVAEGLSYAAVAERLGVSVRTIETHRANLTKKLGLASQVDLARFAIRRGLVTP